MCPTTAVVKKDLVPEGFLSNDKALIGRIARAVNSFQYENMYHDVEIARTGAGPLISDLLDALDKDYGKKLVVFSGHDDGPMAPVLGALKAEVPLEKAWPSFASYLLFEVGDEFVRVLFEGQPLKMKLGLAAGGEGIICDEETGVCKKELLLGYLRSMIPSAEECKHSDGVWPWDAMDAAGKGLQKKNEVVVSGSVERNSGIYV